MAEAKRLQLDPPKPLETCKKTTDILPSYRFELQLGEKESEFTEYSYAELVKGSKKQELESKLQPGSDDPFSLDEDVEKLQEIARKFEEKYNPKPGKRKKKKGKVCEDFIDKGLGYDETDPFIDNEEAYDELVPSTLTTEFGGFYINKGDLDFKNLTEQDCYVEKKNKKKHLKQNTNKEKKIQVEIEENRKRRGRRPLNKTLSAFKLKKKTQPTVADMLHQHKANLQRMQNESLQQIQLEPIKVNQELDFKENDVSPTHTPDETLLNPSTIRDAIESVVKAATVAEESDSNDSLGPVIESSESEEVPTEHIKSIEAPKLPDNLPQDLNDVVAGLKVAAYKSEQGKCKFFSDDVNQMLLSVELRAQELNSAQRAMIYAHLASHLPCTKETLQKRAKKLRLDREDGKLREPMQRLREGIAASMPEMMNKYAALVKACDTRGEKKSGIISGANVEEENGKRLSCLPKKRFEWNDTIRSYLCDVVHLKLKCYEVSKTRTQSAEEYLRHFLDAEVKKLWPAGWMQSRILFRESRAAHFYLTNRPKKQILIPKKTITPSLVSNLKSGISLLNNAIEPHETEFDQIFQNHGVPFIPPVENVLEKNEDLELVSNRMSASEKAAEFNKLFTLPINTSVKEIAMKNSEVPNEETRYTANSEKHFSNTSSLLNFITDSSVTSKNICDKNSKSNKLLPFTPKVPDINTLTEGSLASDMLARIICASLADFPYAGSHNSEKVPKNTNAISTNLAVTKDSYNPISSADTLSNKQNIEMKHLDTDVKKSSHETGLPNFASLGINIESFFNHNDSSISKSNDTINKTKNAASKTSAVNLKLKDTIIPHPRQFAEAFKRTPDTFPLNKKQRFKEISQLFSSSVSNASSLSHPKVTEYQSTMSPCSLDNAQKLTIDIMKNSSAIPSQDSLVTPCKKRSKTNPTCKSNEQWNHFLEASLGTSLLEGMKGFPFPVGAMPTPPPAHSSSPHQTTIHSQHSSRTHSISGLRSDSCNQNSHSVTLTSSSSSQHRQSLIQSPWKSISSQSPSSTSHNLYITSTSPPSSNSCKTTPSSYSTSYNLPVTAYSLLKKEKASLYNSIHNPLSLRASPSCMPLSHQKHGSFSKFSSSMGHASHQASHNMAETPHPASLHINKLDLSNATSISSSSTVTLTGSLEMKPVNPRGK